MALEQQEPGINHCRDLALEQYERYKQACTEAHNKNSSNSGGGGSGNANPSKAAKLGALATSPHYSFNGGNSSGNSNKLAGGKRSYSAAMGGGGGSSNAGYGSNSNNTNGSNNNNNGNGNGLWKNLDEASVLARLPEKLRSLVHLKQLAKEMACGTGNRPMRKAIEEHGKNLDYAYLAELNEYLSSSSSSSDAAAIVVAPSSTGGVALKTEENVDVKMKTEAAVTNDNGDDAVGVSFSNTHNKTTAPTETKIASITTRTSTCYQKAVEVAFLYRYASTLQEQKLLADAYHKHTCACATFPKAAAELQQQAPIEGITATVAVAGGVTVAATATTPAETATADAAATVAVDVAAAAVAETATAVTATNERYTCV